MSWLLWRPNQISGAVTQSSLILQEDQNQGGLKILLDTCKFKNWFTLREYEDNVPNLQMPMSKKGSE